MKIRHILGIGGLTVLLFVAAGPTANALTSWNGSDFTYSSGRYNTQSYYSKTCDRESDETKVKGYIYMPGPDYVLRDTNGNNGTEPYGQCDAVNHSLFIYNVQGSKTCEYRAAWPDSCGAAEWY